MGSVKQRPTTFSTVAINAEVDDAYIIITLEDGIVIKYPLYYFSELEGADLAEKKSVKVFAGGKGLVWESLDVHLNVPRLLGFSEDD